jgi:hypothetical protein
MNLDSYKKVARALFSTSRELELFIEQVWDSGVRSGAASTVERKAKTCLVNEWDWSEEVLADLDDYVIDRAPEGHFADREEARRYVLDELGAIREWAGSQEKPKRKINWTLALKGWIRRGHLPTSSTGRYRRSRQAEADQRDTFNRAVELNSRRVPPSRWNTSPPTGKAGTQRGLPFSSATPNQSH